MDEPPAWAAAPEKSHKYGKFHEAPEDEYRAAEEYCERNPLQPPRLLPSYMVEQINGLGVKAWGLEIPNEPRFVGAVYNIQHDTKTPAVIRVQTSHKCRDYCLLSNLPIMAGYYDIPGKVGSYYEILIHKMDGIISVGTACRPYPTWRHAGWNRLSSGLHLDDFRKFFEDPDGGKDYTDALQSIRPGDTIGCGYEYRSGTLFYTYNGIRLPNAFTGIYLPRQNYDVFAAIGVEGVCDFEVNFGGELVKWQEGNEWQWKVEGIIGRLSGSDGIDEELPSYSQMQQPMF
ncbi:hypothetical protein BDZ89DRAFT_962135 [Hymenopellis radicata]|nr:hypothetical protein BDZ89DRAFT_962135 [Hymenopellis radicata]